MVARKGRGLAAKTIVLIRAIVEIAREIQPCSIRAIAYQLFNRKLIASMAKGETQKVSRLCTIARENGSLPWEWIVDTTRAEEKVATWANPADYARAVQRSYRRDKWQDQPTHVGVWSEKSTVEGTIRPVLEQYEVPFQSVHGWCSATAVWDMARANLDRHQDTRILYIGDYDPSGLYMSEVDLVKRLARYSSNAPGEKDIDLDSARRLLADARMEIRRVALTEADTVALGEGPRFPASDKADKDDKKGDSRYEWFVDNHGHWCWELDAMSPNVLRDRLERAITAELDAEAWERYTRVEETERAGIIELCQGWGSILGHDQK